MCDTTEPELTLSSVRLPAGPRISTVIGGDMDAAGWVRFRVWSADWYVRALRSMADELGGFDRYVGVEMCIDSALSALSGAFDAAVAVLISVCEDRIEDAAVAGAITATGERTKAGRARVERGVREGSARTEPHQYAWQKKRNTPGARDLLRAAGPSVGAEVESLIAAVDEALDTAPGAEPVGWLARLRRIRNTTTHHRSLRREWDTDSLGGYAVGAVDGLGSDPAMVLGRWCDQTSDLTEQMLRVSSTLRAPILLARLPRQRFGAK